MASFMDSLKPEDQDKIQAALDKIKANSSPVEDTSDESDLNKSDYIKNVLNKYQATKAMENSSPLVPAGLMNNKDVEMGKYRMTPEDLTKIGNQGMHGSPTEEIPPPESTTDVVPPNTNPPQPLAQEPSELDNLLSDVSLGGSSSINPQDLADLPKTADQTSARIPASNEGTGLIPAQQAANKNNFYANLMHSVNLLGSGIGGAINQGIAPAKLNDKEQYDALLKSAGQPVENYKEQVADEKNDPNSKYSTELRDFLNKSIPGINIPETTNAAAIEKSVPWILNNNKVKTIQQNTLAFKQMAADDRKRGLDTRIENQANNRFDKDTKDEQNRLQAAKRVEDIINAAKNGTLVDTPNIRNTITNDLSILSLPAGTRATMGDRQKTALNTLGTKLKELNQWWTDHPTKTTPPEFLTQFEVENNILKSSWADALRAKTKSLHAGTEDSSAKNAIANRYKTYAEDYGIEPDFNKKPEQHSSNSFPKVLVNKTTGQKATVSNDKELKEANSEGFQ